MRYSTFNLPSILTKPIKKVHIILTFFNFDQNFLIKYIPEFFVDVWRKWKWILILKYLKNGWIVKNNQQYFSSCNLCKEYNMVGTLLRDSWGIFYTTEYI